MIRLVKQNPFITSNKIKEELNLPVSTSTIRRKLIEKELPARSPRKVPLLTKVHLHKRKQFAQEHLNWEVTKWRNILWTDESKIVLFGTPGTRTFVRRQKNQEFKPECTLKTIKHGGAKINIWGCFSYNGTGPIFWIKPMMTAEVYVGIMRETMLPYAEWNMPLRWVLQQDNDPKHTSKLAKEFFARNGVQVMEWPPQSPDLNPIENLWTDVKKAVFKAKPKNTLQLWEAVQAAWRDIPIRRCQALIDSMPRRCAAVLKNKGYKTKY